LKPYFDLVFQSGIVALMAVFFFAFAVSSVQERNDRLKLAKQLKEISERLRPQHRLQPGDAGDGSTSRTVFPELFKK